MFPCASAFRTAVTLQPISDASSRKELREQTSGASLIWLERHLLEQGLDREYRSLCRLREVGRLLRRRRRRGRPTVRHSPRGSAKHLRQVEMYAVNEGANAYHR